MLKNKDTNNTVDCTKVERIPTTQETALHIYISPDGQYGNQIDYILCSQDEEALYRQQKQDWELTVAQIMNSLLQNSDLIEKSRENY